MRWIHGLILTLLLLFSFLFSSTKSKAVGPFTKSNQNPIITINPSTWESNYVWQPTALLEGSTLKLWYSGYNGSRFQIGLATSTDGLTWSKNGSNPVVSRLNIDNKDAHDPVVIKNGSSYEMWYVGSDNGGSTNFSIYRATSNDGITWGNDPNPVFRPSSGWGSGGVSNPFVLKTQNAYKMWFTSPDTGKWAIGFATSPDGINWSQNAGNPILVKDQSWEGIHVGGPSVIFDGSTYHLWYGTNSGIGPSAIGYATSTDGITWTKPADKNPILIRENTGFDSSMIGDAAVLQISGTTALWYAALGKINNVSAWRIGLATDGPLVIATPTPTPTPIPPVVIVPGMFASWNREAILENKTVSQSEWKINAIVHEYDGITKTLTDMGFVENSSLFIYPYDWRKKLEDAAAQLDAYITSKIPGSTKVDLIGHSLGGMVSRIYAQKYGTGRINKLITVGSPHKGVPQAYKAYAGGDLDRENTLQWLALKLILMLNRGGKTDRQVIADWAPVTQDLIPTYPFLTRLADGTTVDSSTMTYKNDTLLTYQSTFSTLFPLFQSIAGESTQTLSGFTVTTPTASDITNNVYPDGRPSEETKEVGDSTVISSSAKADTDSKTLTLSHGELIYKRDGIKDVISSLGYSVADASVTEGRATGMSPALLLFIKSPATMTVEYAGGSATETDGMIFIENAQSGVYTLKVTGTGKGKYTVVVWQITADNDYWETITGEITKDPPSSQTDYYTINYPSSPLFPASSSSGGSTGGSSTGSSSTSPSSTPTPTPKQAVTSLPKLISNILGASDERESSPSASPAVMPTDVPFAPYQFPQPKNPFALMWWLVGSGLFLLLFAWLLRRYGRR